MFWTINYWWMAICTQNSLIYRFIHWLICLLMISVQPSRKFLWNAPVFPGVRRVGCNMHWDGSSRTVGRQSTCYNVWSSQGQINAVVPFSCVPAGPHFCFGIVVPLSLCFVYIPKSNFLAMRLEAAIHFLMMLRRSSVSRESKQSWGLGWAPGSCRVKPIALPRGCKNVSAVSTAAVQPRTQLEKGGYQTTAAVAACVSCEGWLRSAIAWTPWCQPAQWARGGDSAAWAVDSWGLLSMAWQHSFKH